MTPDQVAVFIATFLGFAGIGIVAATQGTKPKVPAGPVTGHASQVANVTAHFCGRALELMSKHPPPWIAVESAILEYARLKKHLPAHHNVRVLMLDERTWNEWAMGYGISSTANAFYTRTPQMIGSGMPCLVIRVERDGQLREWETIVSLICHEALHMLHGYSHADPKVWWETGGNTSAEGRAYERALRGG